MSLKLAVYSHNSEASELIKLAFERKKIETVFLHKPQLPPDVNCLMADIALIDQFDSRPEITLLLSGRDVSKAELEAKRCSGFIKLPAQFEFIDSVAGEIYHRYLESDSQRENMRYLLEEPVRMQFLHTSLDCSLLDVSEGGFRAFFPAEQFVSEGEHAVGKLFFADSELVADFEVRWLSHDKYFVTFGAQWVAPSPEQVEKIREIIARMTGILGLPENQAGIMQAADFFNSEQGKKYLQAFQNDIFVVKYGGAALESKEKMPYFLSNVAEMYRRGIKIILVHGGGKRLSEEMKNAGIPVVFENGLRLTTPETVEIAFRVFHELNHLICDKLNELGGNALSLTEGITVEARLAEPERPDNRVGEVTAINTGRIDMSKIPVLSSIGHSAGPPADVLPLNTILNINADHLAIKVAQAMKARRIIFISDVNGIYLDPADPSTKLDHVTEAQIQELIASGVLHGGMRLKVEMALEALKNGIEKVHFIDGGIEQSLIQEIFTDRGIGTEIVAS